MTSRVRRSGGLPAVVVLLGVLAGVGPAAAGPAEAARGVVESLSERERAEALRPLDDPDRRRVRYTPGRRGGLALAEMDEGTRDATWAFLDAALSLAGRVLVDDIIQREAILGRITGRPDYRDPDLYYLALYGEPGGPRWAFRFEGHHLSINFTYEGAELVSATPLLLGSNPERTDVAGAPPELLGPYVADAERAAEDPAARERLLERLLAPVPEPLRSAYADELRLRGALSAEEDTARGFAVTGGDTRLELETNQRNHIHLVFRDRQTDFGGP